MRYLAISFLITNILHGWLVVSQYRNNPASLSYHTVKNRRTLLIYITGHLIAGALLPLFVLDVFAGRPNANIIIAVTLVAAITEWAQALLPARGKTDIPHTIFAGVMAFTLALLGFLCTIFFAPNNLVLVINLAISAVVFSLFIFTKYPPPKNFWKIQFLGQVLLYFQMFLLLLG